MAEYTKGAAFLLGLGAMAALFMIYQQKSRKKLLFCKLIADVCWVGHYLLLGAFGGLIPNLVGVFRELTFGRKREKEKITLPLFFIFLNWALLLVCFLLGWMTFGSVVEILPILGSCMVTFALWLKKPTLTKLVSIPVSLFFLSYDVYVGSWIGVINESISLASIILFFIKNNIKNKRSIDMQDQPIFLPCPTTQKTLNVVEKTEIKNPIAIISTEASQEALSIGEEFSKTIEENFISDFKKEGDRMVHVSTFAILDGTVYMTYYANTSTGEEDPRFQVARLVFCPINDTAKKTYLDLQRAGEEYYGKTVDAVYDTILMRKEGDEETLYLMWTASLDGNYYRLYRTYHIPTASLGEVKINRLHAKGLTCDFSFSDIHALFAEKEIPCRVMYSDIGIMQKITSRVENGERYYYTGAYSGDLNFIIKSKDLVTWEYVSQPDFPNMSKWENACYIWGERCYYFVRQHDETSYGFLTYYDLEKRKWHLPVLVGDCQSRSDFIEYDGELYLVYAPIDREHIGILRIDTERLENSEVVLQAKMQESCFYPFVQYGEDGDLYFSYTMNRKAIKFSRFSPRKFLSK